MVTCKSADENNHDQGFPRPVDAQHRIVVFGMPDDPHELRDLLVERLGISPTDAQVHVHALPGVLPDLLPEVAAAALASAIRELGVNAMAIAGDEVPNLDDMKTVHHVRCHRDGLEILDLRGERESVIAWEDIVLVSVGVIPQITGAHHSEVPRMLYVRAGTHQQSAETSLPRHSGPEAILVARNPFRVLRIEHSQMNYEYLGPRLTGSATSNFRWFLQDVVSSARNAWITPACRNFIDRGLFRHYQFRSLDELKRHTLFHLLLRSAQQKPASPSPSPSGDNGRDRP